MVYDLFAWPFVYAANLQIKNILQGKVSEKSRILDIGTGTGMTARHLASVFKAEIVGVDTSPRMLGRAQAIDGKGIEYKQGSALSLPVTGPFDVITMGYLLRHIKPEEAYKVFSEAARVSRYGTTLLVTDLFLPRPGPQQILGVWNIYSKEALTKLASDAGFSHKETRYPPLSILLVFERT